MNNAVTDLSASQLRQAADLKERIDALQGELEQILRNGSPQPRPNSRQNGRTMSAAARARIAAGARTRWAKIRGLKPAQVSTQPRRKMSAAARARLAAIARARWKRARAAGKNAL